MSGESLRPSNTPRRTLIIREHVPSAIVTVARVRPFSAMTARIVFPFTPREI